MTLNIVKPKMSCLLPEKNWSSKGSLATLFNLNSKRKDDVCTIIFDALELEPAVFEVSVDVFQHKSRVVLSKDGITQLKEILGTLEVSSNPELLECIRQSQIDKKKGDVRKYEDIARECKLML